MSTLVAAGSSPAVLGLAGCLLVDFALTWRYITNPKRHFVKLLLVTGMNEYRIQIVLQHN